MVYSVKVNRKETVSAVLPLQKNWLPLSNLDLLLPPLNVGVFLCYQNVTKTPFADMASTLKASLAKVLINYYPFGGEVVANSAGEPEILCNNRGVDFIEAYADVELRRLQLHDPDDSVEGKLVPKKKDGVLCVQATELLCGGLVLSCTFDHRVADAHSANMFLKSWAETARSEPNSTVPSFRRSLLTPRRPGCHTAVPDRLYVPISSLPPPPSAAPTEEAINRIYYIAADDIEKLQAAAAGSSKLVAFTAYLWQIIGKGAKQMGAEACSVGVVVDGRSRLGSSMASYFGNVLSIPYGTLGAAEVAEMPVAEVAAAVRGFVRGAATEEHFRGLVDWVEAHRPEPGVARVYCGPGDGVGDVAVVVSSGQRFPVGEVEFGWGKAAFGSYHFPWGGSSGYVMPMPSTKGDGGWVVYVHLMRGLVEALEAEAGEFFRRLTPDYLIGN